MSPQSPQLSVVIPTYNRSALIGRALRSVLAQTYRATEILVVDDGSTDDTASVVQGFGDRVRYIHQMQAGASKARNHGVAEATSDWIAFLDSDDVWDPEYLDRMVRAISETGQKGWFYFADADFGPDEGSPSLWEQAAYSISGEYQLMEDSGEAVMRDIQPMLLQFSVFNRDVFLQKGGLWESLRAAEDTHLFLRLGLMGPVCAVSGVGGIAMQDENPSNRLTKIYGSASQDHWRQVIMMCQDILQSVPELKSSHRKTLVHWIADSHWRIARLAWASRRIPEVVQSITRATRHEPRMVPVKVWNALRKMWGGRSHT
jgi:glycosyltransferase involved in cell wall biosynthesis